MTTVSEIAPDMFQISTFVPDLNLQFNQFLVRDDEPLLFHTGPRAMFTEIRDALSTLLDPAPKTLATMQGSAFVGDGARALCDLAFVVKEVLGPK
jgi:hypothetical protein